MYFNLERSAKVRNDQHSEETFKSFNFEMMNASLGKFLIVAGIIMIVAGVFFLFGNRLPFFGKLPGDISYKKGNTAIYFPIVTCLVLSIVISLILFLINRFKS